MSSKKNNNIVGIKCIYKIDDSKPIGKGAFSIVYTGTNITTNEKVAIKKIPLDKLSNDKIIVINKEIEIVKILIDMHHLNIVKYYEVVKTNLFACRPFVKYNRRWIFKRKFSIYMNYASFNQIIFSKSMIFNSQFWTILKRVTFQFCFNHCLISDSAIAIELQFLEP